MKVYWSDREGRSAPLNARFQYRPFFPASDAPFFQAAEEVRLLPPPTIARVRRRRFLPEKKDWIAAVKTALSRNIEKVVLARCQILELEEAPDPFALTARIKQNAIGSYVFCYSEGDSAFLGATPERLFRRQGSTLYSEAVAGTRPRGKTNNEDEQLGRELLFSEKDIREISPVRAFLANSLYPLCQSPPSFSPLSLHRTQNVQHLYTECKAVLRAETTDEQILNRIHPTPALCGAPADAARALIRELEPFDRGLYGGALGWSTTEASEWIVGIRSCQIRGRIAYLHAGAGIVAGSDPLKEWEELNQKSTLYDAIFP